MKILVIEVDNEGSYMTDRLDSQFKSSWNFDCNIYKITDSLIEELKTSYSKTLFTVKNGRGEIVTRTYILLEA